MWVKIAVAEMSIVSRVGAGRELLNWLYVWTMADVKSETKGSILPCDVLDMTGMKNAIIVLDIVCS